MGWPRAPLESARVDALEQGFERSHVRVALERVFRQTNAKTVEIVDPVAGAIGSPTVGLESTFERERLAPSLA